MTELAQEKLIDQLIILIGVFGIFLCVFSLLRLFDSGWQNGYYIDAIAAVLLFSLIFCRRLFSSAHRFYFILAIALMVVTADYLIFRNLKV